MSAHAPALAPITVLTRCTYAAYLGTSVLALAFTALACGAGRPLLLLHASLALITAALFRARLAETGQLDACTQDDLTPIAHHTTPSVIMSRRSAAVLRRYTALESLRGTPRFDPWKALAAHRQLSALQRQDTGSSS